VFKATNVSYWLNVQAWNDKGSTSDGVFLLVLYASYCCPLFFFGRRGGSWRIIFGCPIPLVYPLFLGLFVYIYIFIVYVYYRDFKKRGVLTP
jgi:hypothetical protein